ncbi:hypothetical protein [Maricaulis parjimensis]|uniref:hypothetical protein n=1 Tax=Maricaulis parjimensis TaxID=144023 RepID=UPI0019393FB1|nr:hypothetical protein [Maricaulis parjimensis]
MKIDKFSDSDGNVATLEAVRAASETDAQFYFVDIPVSASNLLAAADNENDLDFTPAQANARTNFHEVVCDSKTASFGTIVANEESIPTALEPALCKFILFGQSDLESSSDVHFHFYEKTLKQHSIFEVLEAANKCRSQTAFHKNKTSILTDEESIYAERSNRLIAQSYQFYGTKYGFLELYRSLESGFLDSILSVVNRDFSKNPRACLEKALQSISKERAQLASLIVDNGDSSLLNLLARDFDNLKKGKIKENTFAKEISKLFSKDNSEKISGMEENAWRGAWIIYQIRCSIAHAGSQGLVIEDFDDNEDIISALYDYVERISLSLVGIRFSSN